MDSTHDDHELTYSPLACDVTRDGVTVKIQIYRGPGDGGWLLEVVDHEGGSTVWEDPFESEQAALDEAMQTLATDGIRSFTTSP